MRKSIVVAVIAAAALTLASCAMPADDPNYNAEAALTGDDPSAAASEAAADAAALDTLLLAPTSLGVETPLSAPPAKDAVIISILNSGPLDAVVGAAMDEAATTLGWTHETVTVDSSDPAAAATAFDEALGKNPAGIHISGEFLDSLTVSLPAAETAGIPVVCTGCSGEPAGGITDTSIDGTAQNVQWGDVLATYVDDNQYENEDAAVQVFVLPGGAIADFNSEFDTKLVDLCVECQTSQSIVDPTFTDLTDPVAIAEFLSSEMSISLGAWALLDAGSLGGDAAAALAEDPTLLAPVTVIGRAPSAADIASLAALASAASPAPVDPSLGRDMDQAKALQAWIALPLPVMGWRVMDQFARIIGGDAIETGPLPSQLLTGANAADAVLDADGNYIGIADYQEQFTTLWGIS